MDVCSAAFFFESADRKCKLVGAFPEKSETANAYRGELLGLLAIHLVLLAVNKVNPDLTGKMIIYSDCLRALGSVENLPTFKIPSACKHADILKTILVNCGDLSFACSYEHVPAHQDDSAEFHTLSRQLQLNCAVDAGAKRQILELDTDTRLTQLALPLEPITCFAGPWKLTPGMKWETRFWCHRHLAREAHSVMGTLNTQQFDQIAWYEVSRALAEVPKLFQLWACKQVLGIARVNATVAKWELNTDPRCPSCLLCDETPDHILECNEVGRVDVLRQTINMTRKWLEDMDTDPRLSECLCAFAHGRGGTSMTEICEKADYAELRQFARSQDIIGWRRFMEGMISRGILEVQREHYALSGSQWRLEKWATGLVIKLMEITHGQWLYRNVVVHDATDGRLSLIRKEDILAQIEEQLAMGGEDLLDEDQYLMEVNLDGLEDSNGSRHEYWLLAIRSARVASAIAREQDSTRTIVYGGTAGGTGTCHKMDRTMGEAPD